MIAGPTNGPSDNLAQRGCVLLGKEETSTSRWLRLRVHGAFHALHVRRNEQKRQSSEEFVTEKWQKKTLQALHIISYILQSDHH